MPYIKNAEPVTLNATCDHPVNNNRVEYEYKYPDVVIQPKNVVQRLTVLSNLVPPVKYFVNHTF